jgi:glycosyltransferase involved in cell wall biosynthesis
MSVYNGEKYLKTAIESILNQTYTDFEFIIINDGSTDQSRDIICSYSDNRIRLFDNIINRGLIYSLNKGIEYSLGNVIARMDADDISLPTRFERQINFFNQNPDVSLVGSTAIYVDENGVEKSVREFSVPSNLIYSHLFFGNPFIHSSVIIKKNVFTKYKYNKDFYLAEDYYLWSQIAKEYKVANISEPLVKYRHHDYSISLQKKIEQEECVKKVFDYHLSNILLNNLPEKIKDLHYKLLNYKYDSKTISLKEIRQIHRWIKKLIYQNNKLKVYDVQYFNSKLKTCWTTCFNFSSSFHYGIKAIPLILLFLNRKEKTKVRIRFVYNCIKEELKGF